MALQPLFGPWLLSQFLNVVHTWQDSLDWGSACRKAATYTQNSTNTDRHPRVGFEPIILVLERTKPLRTPCIVSTVIGDIWRRLYISLKWPQVHSISASRTSGGRDRWQGTGAKEQAGWASALAGSAVLVAFLAGRAPLPMYTDAAVSGQYGTVGPCPHRVWWQGVLT
jgi:hypothetical protein